jgi:poly(3-hydroxybutyrate) depolymerase
MKRGGANIFTVQDSCGIPDRVKGELRYEGGTRRSVDINDNATCNANDGKSVIGFGDLPSGYTAFACVSSWIQDGPNRVAQSDIRLNKKDHAWTTSVRDSCRGRYDIESTVTHETGHTFGPGEADESAHGDLTMSAQSNGTCQTSERSLGRVDARGLNSKY